MEVSGRAYAANDSFHERNLYYDYGLYFYRQLTIDGLCKSGKRSCVRYAGNDLYLGVEQVEQVLVVMGIYLDQQSELAQGVLRLYHLRYLLQCRNHLVIHRRLLHLDTDIYAELVAQHLRLHMVTGAGDNTIIEHLLHTLMDCSTTHTALVCYVFERNTRTLGDNLQDFTVQLINFFHYFSKMFEFCCKGTTFFAYMQEFL